jgi:hypothetical protein
MGELTILCLVNLYCCQSAAIPHPLLTLDEDFEGVEPDIGEPTNVLLKGISSNNRKHISNKALSSVAIGGSASVDIIEAT